MNATARRLTYSGMPKCLNAMMKKNIKLNCAALSPFVYSTPNRSIHFSLSRFNNSQNNDMLGEPSEKVKRLVDEVISLNIVEVNQLLKAMQKRLGVTNEMMASMGTGKQVSGDSAGTAAAAPAAVEPVKEKEAFSIKLGAVDQKAKIKIIKEVRTITGLGLKEAKDLVEKAPVVVKEGVKKEEAEALKKTLEEAGAVVELV